MQQLPGLLRAMESIASGAEPPDVLDRVVRAAAELAGTRFAALALLDEDGDGAGRFVTWGEPPAGDWTAPARALLDGGRPDPGLSGTLCVPVLVHGARFAALLLAGRPERPFTEEDRQATAVLATGAGAAIGDARLHAAMRQQARWMDGSLELSTSLLSADADTEDTDADIDEDNILAVVAEQARRLTAAGIAAVLEPAADDGLEVVAASTEDPAGLGGLIGTTVPGHGPAVRQVLAGEPVFLDDPATDPRLVTGLVRPAGPSMLLPLAGHGAALGALFLGRAAGAAGYAVPERAMATQFAQQAALALLLLRARRDRAQLAVLADRDRIARDLHDLVIQRLFAVGMTLETARRATPSEDVRDRLDTATGELDATVQEIRTAIFALQQGPEEAPTSLRTRVLRETGAAARTLGFTPSAVFTGPVDALVGAGVARNLIAALREGLSNAARHARAGRVEVEVDATATLPDGRDAVRLTVADDGVGLPSGDTRRSGLGNLARRAESLGGSARLDTGLDGTGTKLTWQVPR